MSITPRQARILGALRLTPMTRPELCKRLALKRTAIQSDVAELASIGRIRACGKKRSKDGAPAALWEIAA